MTRVDYFNDPDAPMANSIVPSVTAVVTDETDSILLVHKTDNGLWALPGGGVDPGETVSDAVVREVEEETGVRVEVRNLIGVYTNPRHVMAYDDGEVRQQFSLCFEAEMLGGSLRTSNETDEVQFFPVGGTRHASHSSLDATQNPALLGVSCCALHWLGRQSLFGKSNGLGEVLACIGDRSVDGRVRLVPRQYLFDALVEVEAFACRASGHVCRDKCVHDWAGLPFVLLEFVGETAFDRFESRTRVMCDEPHQSRVPVMASEVPRTVQRMKSRLLHVR